VLSIRSVAEVPVFILIVSVVFTPCAVFVRLIAVIIERLIAVVIERLIAVVSVH